MCRLFLVSLDFILAKNILKKAMRGTTMICKYCQHDHGELHECDIDDVKQAFDQLVAEAEDYVAIICSLKGVQDAVETTH
jgi:hypothetical protein